MSDCGVTITVISGWKYDENSTAVLVGWPETRKEVMITIYPIGSVYMFYLPTFCWFSLWMYQSDRSNGLFSFCNPCLVDAALCEWPWGFPKHCWITCIAAKVSNQFNSIQFNSSQFNPIQSNPIQSINQSNQFNQINSVQLNSTQLKSTELNSNQISYLWLWKSKLHKLQKTSL